jgi:ribose transport system substrate-binding protein
MDTMTRTGHGRRRLLLPAILVTGVLIAASCGDDDDSSGATTAAGGATTTAAGGEATTTAAGGATTTAAGGEATTTAAGGATTTEGAGGGSEGAARAKEIVDKWIQRPTELGIDTPIDAEIPEGQRIYFISCGVDVCEAEADMATEAAETLGWEVTKLSTDGTPPSVQTAWETVIRDKADGVMFTGTAIPQIQTFINQAVANGTTVVACCISEPADKATNGISWTTSTPEQTGELGEITAAWVVNDAAESGDESPGMVYLDLPDFPILTSLAENTEKTFKELCAGCQYDKLSFGLADLGAVNDNVVSFLRSNPDTKYVVTSTAGPFAGLPAAFKAAGLNDIKIFTGSGPSLVNQANIAAGTEAGGMAFAFYEVIYGMIDAIAREKAGVEIQNFPPPNWILTKDNLPSVDHYFEVVEGSRDFFVNELWGKGGGSGTTPTT